MALIIKASSLASVHSLEVHSRGVTYIEGVAFTKKKEFPFSDIDFIVMSSKNVLSFQVDNSVFSISVNPKKKKHQQVIDTLVEYVRLSASSRT